MCVEIGGHDQLSQLGAIFNDMADRLEATERKERHLDWMRRELQGWVGRHAHPCQPGAGYGRCAGPSGVLDNPDTYLRFLRSAQRNVHIMADLVDDLYDITHFDAERVAANRAGQCRATRDRQCQVADDACREDKGIVLTGSSARAARYQCRSAARWSVS